MVVFGMRHNYGVIYCIFSSTIGTGAQGAQYVLYYTALRMVLALYIYLILYANQKSISFVDWLNNNWLNNNWLSVLELPRY